MTDRLLISKEDFYEYEAITTNTSPDNILPYIREAQKFDLTPILGKEFVSDMQENVDTAIYQSLLPYVRPVLAYYSYARYILSKNAVDTPYGFVQKTNEFSQPVTEKTIARIVEQARNSATAYAREMIEFIKDNNTDYPLYVDNSCTSSIKYERNIVVTNINTKS
jgi:hypothetical protein